MVQRICYTRLQKTEALHSNSKVMVVRSEVFTRFRIAVFLASDSYGTKGRRVRQEKLTICSWSYSIPNSLRILQTLLGFMYTVSHTKEPFIWLFKLRKRVEKRVGNGVQNASWLFIRWMSNVLVHRYMLKKSVSICKSRVGNIYIPIR